MWPGERGSLPKLPQHSPEQPGQARGHWVKAPHRGGFRAQGAQSSRKAWGTMPANGQSCRVRWTALSLVSSAAAFQVIG